MELETIASALKELGHPKRLSIYKLLVKSGLEGMPVGSLKEALDIPGSTLNHHISSLMSVGLVKQVRQGRTLICISQYEVLEDIIEFLQDECCVQGTGELKNKSA